VQIVQEIPENDHDRSNFFRNSPCYLTVLSSEI